MLLPLKYTFYLVILVAWQVIQLCVQKYSSLDLTNWLY